MPPITAGMPTRWSSPSGFSLSHPNEVSTAGATNSVAAASASPEKTRLTTSRPSREAVLRRSGTNRSSKKSPRPKAARIAMP